MENPCTRHAPRAPAFAGSPSPPPAWQFQGAWPLASAQTCGGSHEDISRSVSGRHPPPLLWAPGPGYWVQGCLLPQGLWSAAQLQAGQVSLTFCKPKKERYPVGLCPSHDPENPPGPLCHWAAGRQPRHHPGLFTCFRPSPGSCRGGLPEAPGRQMSAGWTGGHGGGHRSDTPSLGSDLIVKGAARVMLPTAAKQGLDRLCRSPCWAGISMTCLDKGLSSQA